MESKQFNINIITKFYSPMPKGRLNALWSNNNSKISEVVINELVLLIKIKKIIEVYILTTMVQQDSPVFVNSENAINFGCWKNGAKK